MDLDMAEASKTPKYYPKQMGTSSITSPDGRDKHCGFLAIRDEETTVGLAMTSAWELEPHEIAALVAGAPIYLTVCGAGHPPVSLAVGIPPDEVAA